MFFRMTSTMAVMNLITILLLPTPSFGQPTPKEQDQRFAVLLMRATLSIEKEYERPIPHPQMITWAIHGLYDEFKKPVPRTLQRRLSELKNSKDADKVQLLQNAYTAIFADKKDGSQKAIEICIATIFRKLEPGTPLKERSGLLHVPNVRCIYRSALYGIGLKLKTDPNTGLLRVVTPIYKGPAYKAGIRGGDLITHITSDRDFAGRQLEQPREYSTKGMTPEQAYELFLGKHGTAFTLKVLRGK